MNQTKAQQLTPEQQGRLAAQVSDDKELGSLLITAARKKQSELLPRDFSTGIASSNHSADEFNKWIRDEQRILEEIHRSGFFARVSTLVEDHHGKENLVFLITKARGLNGTLEGMFHGKEWISVSWTRPLTKELLGKKYNESFMLLPSRTNRGKVVYQVFESVTADQYLPEVQNATYQLNDLTAYLPSGDSIESGYLLFIDSENSQQVAELPPREFEPSGELGLKDIIVLSDDPQREAMHLPFNSNILIEGPPGSGKTSIALMRIACLIDQQWEELNLQRNKDKPYHSPQSMHVLVYNEEMVSYLQRLVESIGIQGVRVKTTKDFFRAVCRNANTLSGQYAHDRPKYFRKVKARPEILNAYWRGLQLHTVDYWRTKRSQLKENPNAQSHLAQSLILVIDAWVSKVSETAIDDSIPSNRVNLANGLNWAVKKHDPGDTATPSERQEYKSALQTAKDLFKPVLAELVDRKRIVSSMFETKEYADLLNSARLDGVPDDDVDKADEKWREQYQGKQPSYSEIDAMCCAWLGNFVTLTDSLQPHFGGSMPQITHFVIDEAQDLSACHLQTLRAMLSPNGTLTLSGDVHQNLDTGIGIHDWNQLRTIDLERRAFGLNYRQSSELGSFVSDLHTQLFNEPPTWSPSSRWHGPSPHFEQLRSWSDIADSAARMISQWVEEEPQLTIGFLYDSQLPKQALADLSGRLGEQIAHLLLDVSIVGSGAHSLSNDAEGKVLLGSVQETKGLEFDAVLFADPSNRWSSSVNEVELRDKNALYVAASRAKQYLALLLGGTPEWAESLD